MRTTRHAARPWREPGLVVGYDGSQDGRRALRWALIEARLRHCAVTVCDVWGTPPDIGIDKLSADLFRRRESHVLDAGLEMARRWEHGIPLRPLLVHGFPVTELRLASRNADLLVVGSRGHGAVEGLLLGSVSAGVAAHAACPVVIVRPPPSRPAGSPIVVGFDGSAPAVAALRLAFTEASLRSTRLTVVHADPSFPASGVGSRRGDHAEAIIDTPHRILGLELDRLADEFPSVKHRVELVAEEPRVALMTAAENARMLVVGSRGAGGVRGMVLGSVSQHLVRRSPCTTLVVHAR